MRKLAKRLVIPALVLGALVFAGGRTALADGYHHGHRGHGGHSHYSHYGHHSHRGYYGGGRDCYRPSYPAYGYRAYAVYPPYAAYRAPAYYGGQASFYNRGPNYSFGLSYGW